MFKLEESIKNTDLGDINMPVMTKVESIAVKDEPVFCGYEDNITAEERCAEIQHMDIKKESLPCSLDEVDQSTMCSVTHDHVEQTEQAEIEEENNPVVDDIDLLLVSRTGKDEIKDETALSACDDNIIIEEWRQNIETNNVTKTTDGNNMTTNSDENDKTPKPDPVPENSNTNLVTVKLDYLKELLSKNIVLSNENEFLKETIQRFQNLEQETKRGFAAMQVQLDKVFELLKSTSFSSNEFIKEENITNIDDEITQTNIEFPINSVEYVDLLENELMNPDFEEALIKKISKIFGSSGSYKIGRIGLQITKSLFTDELLNRFTWKGIKGCSKLPFMRYTNIRNCFYKIVRLADNDCTSVDADSFLQNSAIKHSGQRIKRKLGEMKTSTSKKKRSEMKRNTTITTINNKSVESYINIKAINNLDQEKEETNVNLDVPNIEDEVINTNLEMKKNPRQYESEKEDQFNEKQNKIDDDKIAP